MRGASTRSLASQKARTGKPGVGGGDRSVEVDVDVDRLTTVVAGDSDSDMDYEKAAGVSVGGIVGLGVGAAIANSGEPAE
jgi:hypothetical protein